MKLNTLSNVTNEVGRRVCTINLIIIQVGMSTSCEMADMKKIVQEGIDLISPNIGEYLGFDCLADEEILRHANDCDNDYDSYESSAETTGMKNMSLWLWWIQRIAVTIFLLLQTDSKTQN